MAKASGGDDVATCLGSWPEEESDDFVFKPLGVVRAWKAGGGSGESFKEDKDVFPRHLSKIGEYGERASLLASSRRFGLVAAALGDTVYVFPPSDVAVAAQNETEDEPPALLETLLQETPNSICLESVDGFSKKSKPIHSVRFVCNDEILQLVGLDAIALFRLRDLFQSRKCGHQKALSTMTLEDGEILSSSWHQRPGSEEWMLMLSLKQSDGKRAVRLYDVIQETGATRLILKQEMSDCFEPILIHKGGYIVALSETNRLGIVLYDQSLSESQKVVNVSFAQPDKGADDDDDRLVSWQLVKECEDTAEFAAVSQGKQVKILQLSITFADSKYAKCSFSVVEGDMIIAEEIERAESSGAMAGKLSPSVYVETFPPWPVITISYALSPEEHMSVLDTSGERWRMTYPSNDGFKACLLRPQYFDDEEEEEEEEDENEVYVRGLTIGSGLGKDGYSGVEIPEEMAESAKGPGLLFALDSSGLITVLSVIYLGAPKPSDAVPDHCNQPEPLENLMNSETTAIKFETNDLHIKLGSQKEDTKSEKIGPKADSIVHAHHPVVTSNQAPPKPDSQHTHAKTVSDSTATANGRGQAEPKVKQFEAIPSKPFGEINKGSAESLVAKSLFGGLQRTGANAKPGHAINGLQKETSRTLTNQISPQPPASPDKKVDLKAMPETQIQQEISSMEDKARELKRLIKLLESQTLPSEAACVDVENDLAACQRRHKLLVARLHDLEVEHSKASKSTDELDQYIQAPELEIQQQILPTNPHIARMHSIQSRIQVLKRCMHEAQEFFKHNEMKSPSRQRDPRARTQQYEVRKKMHTALLSVKEMIASSNKCLQSLTAIESEKAKYESEDYRQARQGIKDSLDSVHRLENRHKTVAREAGALTKIMKTWKIEREQVTLKSPKQSAVRNREKPERKSSSSAENAEVKQTDDKKIVAGPFSSASLQRGLKPGESKPSEDSVEKLKPQRSLFQKDMGHLQQNAVASSSTHGAGATPILGDKKARRPSEVSEALAASAAANLFAREDNESRNLERGLNSTAWDRLRIQSVAVARVFEGKTAEPTPGPPVVPPVPVFHASGNDSLGFSKPTTRLDKSNDQKQEDIQRTTSAFTTRMQLSSVEKTSLKQEPPVQSSDSSAKSPAFSFSNIASSLERTAVTSIPKLDTQEKDEENSQSHDVSTQQSKDDAKLNVPNEAESSKAIDQEKTNTSTPLAGAGFGGFQNTGFEQAPGFNFKPDKGSQGLNLSFDFSKTSLDSKASPEKSGASTASESLNKETTSPATGTGFNISPSSKGVFQQHSYLGPATKHKSPFGDPKNFPSNDAGPGFSISNALTTKDNSKPAEAHKADSQEPKLEVAGDNQPSALDVAKEKTSTVGLPIVGLKVSDDSLGSKQAGQAKEAESIYPAQSIASQSSTAVTTSIVARSFESTTSTSGPSLFSPPETKQAPSTEAPAMEMEMQSGFSFQNKSSGPPALFSAASSAPGQNSFMTGSNVASMGTSSIGAFGQTMATPGMAAFGQPRVPGSPFSSTPAMEAGSRSFSSQASSQYPVQLGGFSQSAKIGHQANLSPSQMTSTGGGFTAFANRATPSTSGNPFASAAQSSSSFGGNNNTMGSWSNNSMNAGGGSGMFGGASNTAPSPAFGNASVSAFGSSVSPTMGSSSSGFQSSSGSPFGGNVGSSMGSFQGGSFGTNNQSWSLGSSQQPQNNSAFTQMRR